VYLLVQSVPKRADSLRAAVVCVAPFLKEITVRTTLFISDTASQEPRSRSAKLAATWLLVCAAGCWIVLGHAGSAIANVPLTGLTDAEILGTYIQVNGFDVETALLGRSQASSAAVRELATRVASDHLGVRQAAFELAAKCKVSPVLPSGRVSAAQEHGRAMTTLVALMGAAFDKAYLQHEAAFHHSAIDAVRQVLQPSARCPALKAHFNEVLPAFERHLSETQALARELTAR
jgi:putative membrane protein